jgi:hypothetical protein
VANTAIAFGNREIAKHVDFRDRLMTLQSVLQSGGGQLGSPRSP